MGAWTRRVRRAHSLKLSGATVLFVLLVAKFRREGIALALARAQTMAQSLTELERSYAELEQSFAEVKRSSAQTSAELDQSFAEVQRSSAQNKAKLDQSFAEGQRSSAQTSAEQDRLSAELDQLCTEPDRSDASFYVAFALFLVAVVLSIFCGAALHSRLLDKSPVSETERCVAVFVCCLCGSFVFITSTFLIM
jgi:ABC-type Na+ efflux pump permease subunit